MTLNGSSLQLISNASNETFYNLILNNSGAGISLNNGNIIVTNSLTMSSGNINAGSNLLTLGTGIGNVGTLTYSSGIIIGQFERWINATGAPGILYPVGIASTYRPALITFNALNSGSIIGEFISGNPGASGLPLSEAGIS